jgi:hypothetical protein
MRRLVVVVALASAFAIPSVVLLTVASGTASAQTAPSCKKLTGTISGNFTISKCTPKNKQDKTATGSSLALAGGSGSVTWSPSNGTTDVTVTFSQASSNTGCKSGATKYDISGSVTGGTSTYTASGQSVSAEACDSSTGSLSLAKGTTMTL